MLDADDTAEVTRIAAAVFSEMARNSVRGTGGSTLPLPITRLGTIEATANGGGEARVRADGDDFAVPALNVCGFVVEPGDRVVAGWGARGEVRILHQLSRVSRGNWTPTIGGPSSNGTNQSGAGHYTRIGHRVHAYGKWVFGSGGSFGTAPTLGDLPFPVISDGDGILGQFQAVYNDVSIPRFFPLQWLVAEGATRGQVFFINALGGAATLLTPVGDGANAPAVTAAAAGDTIHLFAHYDTDAG